MREEASFHMFFEKVKASKGKLEIDDTQLSKKRKVSSKELSEFTNYHSFYRLS